MKRGKDLSLEKKEEIITLNRIDKLSPKKIAEKFSISVNTVKTVIRKANKADRNGIRPSLRGRPLAETATIEMRIKRLEMENRLLRDFLQSSGRK